MKLKDYLSASDYKKLEHLDKEALDNVFITYRIDTLPQALPVTIPCTYDEELFEHAYHPSNAEANGHGEHEKDPVPAQRLKQGLFHRTRKEDDPVETVSQKHTSAVETLADSEMHSDEDKSDKEQQHVKELSKELPDVMDSLASNGRKVAIFGKAPNAAQRNTYVIAGAIQKSSGESDPGAVVVNEKTAIFDHHGHRVSKLAAAMQDLNEGEVVIVEGKRSKRNVVQAKRLVLP
ncbi:hypothetical protein [Dictyobacter kobayashii]|uniref:Uncharacterized protein n=1 Tax=Dictyobacter kobayashii TaxID=2014872 RepID=A0A402ANE1_9CHLR|nr:hypothetical protein [Dictyobacter kobayashii]GCE20673.1 hypothetical protein KDK_44730 [Dictyobacter kobayashii]